MAAYQHAQRLEGNQIQAMNQLQVDKSGSRDFSPASDTRLGSRLDRSRVTLLLEINAELFRETLQLQTAGKMPQEDKSADKGFYGYVVCLVTGSTLDLHPVPNLPN